MTTNAYIQNMEKTVGAILRAQAHCGEKLAEVYEAPDFDVAAFTAALRIGSESIVYFAQDILHAEVPSQEASAGITVRDFASYVAEAIAPLLANLSERAEKCSTKEEAAEVLAAFLEVLGDERMQYHMSALEKCFSRD